MAAGLAGQSSKDTEWRAWRLTHLRGFWLGNVQFTGEREKILIELGLREREREKARQSPRRHPAGTTAHTLYHCHTASVAHNPTHRAQTGPSGRVGDAGQPTQNSTGRAGMAQTYVGDDLNEGLNLLLVLTL